MTSKTKVTSPMPSTAPPKRRKGASKKLKKSWRKNTDLDDVDEFLEDQRLEQRLGGSYDHREDDELFVVDTGNKDKDGKSEAPLTKRAARKKAAAERPLKCFQNILPDVERPVHVTPGTRKNPLVEAKEKKLKEQGVIKAKEKLSKKHKAEAAKTVALKAKAQATRRRADFNFDLWDGDLEVTEESKDVKANQWLGHDTKVHTLTGTRQKGGKPALKPRAPSTLSAVAEPLGGESYNPSFKDHQDLLFKATLVELRKEKAQHNVDYHTTRMFPKRPPTEEERAKEMTEGLFEDADGEKDQEDEVEARNSSTCTAEGEDGEDEDEERKGNKPKTRKQKRNEKARRLQELKADKLKRDKALDHDFTRLKSIKKQLKAEEDQLKGNKARRVQRKANKLQQAAKLSNYKFEEADVDLKLSEELTGNLRNLKPEGNILTDRFKSMQKRNLIETRVKQKVKRDRRKRKIVERRTHKMGFAWEKSK